MGLKRNRWHEAIDDPLPGVRDQLVSEYGETVPSETIDRAAQQALDELSDAPLREFVPVFACVARGLVCAGPPDGRHKVGCSRGARR